MYIWTSMRKWILLLFLLPLRALAQADTSEADSIDPYKLNYSILPLVYYLPETSVGFGVGGIVTFRFRTEEPDSRPSQFQLGASYTLMDQFLLYFPYRLFWNKSKYLTYGELGYYKYVYFYYGIGGGAPNSNEEVYSVSFPRIRNSFLYQFFPDTYIGGRYWFDDFKITKVDSAGLLVEQDVTGSRGGAAGGLGLVVNHDSRDDQFYPSRGTFIEGVVLPHTHFFGSDFSFLKISLDASRYYSLTGTQILALNFYGESNLGKVPFYQMALLGGNKRLRGLYEGRYRDNNSLIVQAEYRWRFYRRFGLAFFAGAGNVFSEPATAKAGLTQYTYGGGLRFRLSKREKGNLRLDVGFSSHGSVNYYLTFGEAF
ncbi:MAG: hypothetical protein CMI35_17220 [Owenweeksia sp.]|nr:hypothetical protein [Owenweeksia sp.]